MELDLAVGEQTGSPCGFAGVSSGTWPPQCMRGHKRMHTHAYACAGAARAACTRTPQPERTARIHWSRLPATLPARATGGLHTGMPPSLAAALPGTQHSPGDWSAFKHALAQAAADVYVVRSVPAAPERLVLLQVQI